MKKTIRVTVFLTILQSQLITAQVITREDSLNAGLTPKTAPTVLSGYGHAKVEYDLRNKTGVADLTRNVIFLGHRFSNKISFFSELELESAKVEGGKASGEISMEQLFVKFNLNRNNYLVGGLFIPRIGIINENHLPTTFNSNDRHFVERFIIPATWRELGIGLYGQIPKIPGLNYSAAIMNGLNSTGFDKGSVIRGGRYKGSNASASNLALSSALLSYFKHLRLQASTYYGGSAGLSKKLADSLRLKNGAFGTPVFLNEVNLQYNGSGGLQFKALACYLTIKDAFNINRAYKKNAPTSVYGYFAEIGYNVFKPFQQLEGKSMLVFVRYENMDLNATVPENVKKDALQERQYFVVGVHFQPLKGISIKLDYVSRITSKYKSTIHGLNPYSERTSSYRDNEFINLGIGYSF